MCAAAAFSLAIAASGQDAALQSPPPPAAGLEARIGDGHLADLRWPDFTDYRVHVHNFYAPAQYALAWVRDGAPTSQALAVISLLEDADQRGLHAADYDGPRWAARLARLKQTGPRPDEDELARFDLALTVSLMRYISDLHIGKVNPHHFNFGLDIENKKYKLQDLLREKIVNAADVGAVLAQVEPQFEGYRRTVAALQNYLALERRGDGAPVPVPKETVEPGDTYPAAPLLARRLELLGDLPPAAAEAAAGAPAPTYEGALVDAVSRFQRRHGLDPDGRLGAKTVRAINVPLARRVLQLQLALERWRWIPPDFPRPPVVVNIPEFRLRAFDVQQNVALSMKVVVGRAYRHRTPVFANEMRYIVFRPNWNVPMSIQRAELVPKIRADRSYLQKNNYELLDSRGRPMSEDSISDATLAELAAGRISIRQKPGEDNALGPVKFIFPNDYNVYLHGTPAPQLFARARRDFSHGCIRLEDPFALARWVLRDQPAWTEARIKAAMDGDQPVTVKLETPIPVLILYATAVVQPDGEVDFFDDIYGHDADLEKVLAKGYPYPG